MRTIVTCRTDLPTLGQAPERRLCLLLSAGLLRIGQPVGRPRPRGRFAWEVARTVGAVRTSCVVALLDADADAQWYVEADAHGVHDRATIAATTARLGFWVRAVHHVLAADHRVHDVRWWERPAFAGQDAPRWSRLPVLVSDERAARAGR